MIDALATVPYHREHLAPIWAELQRRGLAGDFHILAGGGNGRDRPPPRWHKQHQNRPVLIAGWVDYQHAGTRPIVFVNHGAGQTYDGDARSARHPSYSGGRERDRVILHLEPGEIAAAKTRAAQPDVPVAEVGCPKMDPWHRTATTRSEIPTVAVTFHWPNPICPEAGSALPHYHRRLDQLVDTARHRGWRLIGHGHPRAWPHHERMWRKLEVEPAPTFAEVLDSADVLVVDNSSAGWEFMSTGRPVVWLNTPAFRRDVDHGLRFWEHADSGVQCDHPDQLADAIAAALQDPPDQRQRREAAIRRVYTHIDGRAAVRAADAITAMLHAMPIGA